MGLFGSGGGEVSGYNCQQVNALRDVINNIAQQAGNNIVERLHNDIIVPMSNRWWAPEAVDFFTDFAATVKASGENIRMAFDTFRGAVEAAGKNWAENTGGEIPSLPAIDTVDLILDVSAILPEIGGDVKINETEASALASSLPDVEEGIKSDLRNLASDLSAESAFIGHGQAEALQQCFVTVSGELHKIFKYLTDGENSLQSQINAAAQKYGEVATGIADAYNNSSVE